MERSSPIADHGLIGDLQTAALVATDGTIDFFCCPRFDSPSVFAALLDPHRGGYFRITPEGSDYVTKQLYFPDSAILITRFMATDGVGEVIDFMPIDRPTTATAHHELVRRVRVVRGSMRFTFDCAPRFDYGRQPHDLMLAERGAVFSTRDLSLTLHVDTGLAADPALHGVALQAPDPISLVRTQDDVSGSFTLQAGQVATLVLESAAENPPGTVAADAVNEMLVETGRFWRDWLERSTYRGRWREMVSRSAMTLKLMTYAPTGALVAAVTTGLPEEIGGERNWDYRYTWIRDASFSVYALLGLGYVDEAAAFLQWVNARVGELAGDHNGASPLKIMYRVDGSSDLHEESLDHFEGYLGSRPVRIGNGASDQLQLDIYGELMDSLYLADSQGIRIGDVGWKHVRGVLDWLCEHWDQPEEGIWETRGGQQPFTYGRLMLWVAMDRAIRIAQHHGLPADLPRLTATRDAIYQQIMDKGWNATRGAFVQHYNTDVLDASLLLMPLVGFISPTDPMWLSTLREMDEELVSDSLVYRYNPSASPDGLRGHEGTFSIATYWYVDALARSGRLEDARLTFEKMATYANHLGLFSEQIGLTGGQQGNFPQAFTHLALINAALNLNYQLDHGAGQVGLNELGTRTATR
ncbi:MAG TPA: glycoside hydrolase family 15 protein [Ktedonobacterales bacterium]|nr:glycoside hydrolase family 15 protein [Ktedonobacterales bacterium]